MRSSLVAIAFTVSILATSSAPSRKEELERAAELAVERAAERVAERAVEKALESGNSTTETETVRVRHSSVRKYDSTQQLPGLPYISPEARHENERITKEREAAELAVVQIKRGRFLAKRGVKPFRPSPQIFDHYPQQQQQQITHRHHQDTDEPSEHQEAPHMPRPYHEEQYPVTVREVKQIYQPVYYAPTEKKSNEHEYHQIPVAPQPIRFFEVHQKSFPIIYFYHRPPPQTPVPRVAYVFPQYEPEHNEEEQKP